MKKIFSTDIFISGKEGYFATRIPALAKTNTGILLAFCEARKFNFGDPGTPDNQIALVVKRSNYGRRTWSQMRAVEEKQPYWSAANPAPVVNSNTGRLLVPCWKSEP
ncbi:MAG: glycoside hydrolase [Candidatus Omnitrophica bacterium]|nr:glycoside hydrolase [Candidatus Omnitrophota bacterium]